MDKCEHHPDYDPTSGEPEGKIKDFGSPASAKVGMYTYAPCGHCWQVYAKRVKKVWRSTDAKWQEVVERVAELEARVTRRNLTNHDLEAENLLMREALDVYADKDAWHGCCVKIPTTISVDGEDGYELPGWQVAKKALKTCDGATPDTCNDTKS